MRMWTKNEIAADLRVTTRSVDNWRERGLLEAPVKLGSAPQSRVRWTDAQVAQLRRNLELLQGGTAIGDIPMDRETPATRAAAV